MLAIAGLAQTAGRPRGGRTAPILPHWCVVPVIVPSVVRPARDPPTLLLPGPREGRKEASRAGVRCAIAVAHAEAPVGPKALVAGNVARGPQRTRAGSACAGFLQGLEKRTRQYGPRGKRRMGKNDRRPPCVKSSRNQDCNVYLVSNFACNTTESQKCQTCN